MVSWLPVAAHSPRRTAFHSQPKTTVSWRFPIWRSLCRTVDAMHRQTTRARNLGRPSQSVTTVGAIRFWELSRWFPEPCCSVLCSLTGFGGFFRVFFCSFLSFLVSIFFISFSFIIFLIFFVMFLFYFQAFLNFPNIHSEFQQMLVFKQRSKFQLFFHMFKNYSCFLIFVHNQKIDNTKFCSHFFKFLCKFQKCSEFRIL